MLASKKTKSAKCSVLLLLLLLRNETSAGIKFSRGRLNAAWLVTVMLSAFFYFCSMVCAGCCLFEKPALKSVIRALIADLADWTIARCTLTENKANIFSSARSQSAYNGCRFYRKQHATFRAVAMIKSINVCCCCCC
jgi:hypothetical protein